MPTFGILFVIIQVLTVQYPPSLADIGVRRSGPYKVVVEKLTSCDDQGTGEVVLGTRITKTSDGKYMYDNPIYLGYPIDQDFKLHLELQSFSNGGYRPRYIQHTFKGCDEMWKYFQDIYKKMLRAAGSTVEKCPLPAGNYTTKNFELNIENVKTIPVMMYNKYKTVGTIFYKTTKVGCINVYGEFVPK